MEDDDPRFRAAVAYLATVGGAIGRLRSMGGEPRRCSQHLERTLGEALEIWIEQHPEEDPFVLERVRDLHNMVLRSADKARDYWDLRSGDDCGIVQ